MIDTTSPSPKRVPRLRYSRRLLPSMYSIAICASPFSSPYSWIATMPGCDRRPPACASFLKRASIECARPSSTDSRRTVLIATVRRMFGSNALYTTPMAPRPITSVIWYLPRRWSSDMPRLVLEHLHRLHQAFLHAVEGIRQRADLVLRAHSEVGDVHAAQAHLIGEHGEAGHRPDHHRDQHRVEDDADEQEYPRKEQHEAAVSGACTLRRHVGGDRDDLSADHLVQLPAEAVGRTVSLDQGARRDIHRAVAGEAGAVADLDRPRDIQEAPGRRVALADDLAVL